MQRRIIFYSGLLLVLLTTAPYVLASTPPSRIDGLRQSVLALDSAWTMAINDFHHKKKSGSLAESEQKDYAKFITFLSGRIDHYCQLLRSEGGEEAIINLPCADSSTIDSGLEKPTAQTKNEQVAELDKSLTEALGEFDEQLLKEEQRIAGRTPAERESGSGYGGGGGAGSSGQSGSGQNGGSGQGGTGSTQGQESSQSGSESSQSGQESSQSGEGTTASSSGAGAGAGSQGQQDDPRSGSQEIESGYDDIVARQLREAAEKETDPELKKKLWEEYRKYKEGIN